MTQNQESFIRFMLENNVLKFGDFTLKSGRQSPFFLNLGDLNSGYELTELGKYYAEEVWNRYGKNVDVVFGPAYKGIPIAAAVAWAYWDIYGYDIRYSSNRKEIKDHGDAGILLGAKLNKAEKTKVVIVEDVTTSGKSMEETVPILKAQNVEILGLIVSVDRCEIGPSGIGTALEEVSRTHGFPASAIVSMPEIVEYLKINGKLDDEMIAKINEYYKKYGPKKGE